MESIVWTSDLHLNTLDDEEKEKLYTTLRHAPGSSIIISGDISDGKAFYSHLIDIVNFTQKNVYYILGNHDYWGHSFSSIRRLAKKLGTEHSKIHYLSGSNYFALSDDVALVGHDGWADAQDGAFTQSSVLLRDWSEIEDFKGMSKDELKDKLREIGEDAVDELMLSFAQALEKFSKVILVTHVPAFREVCLDKINGEIATEAWACHTVWKALGNALLRRMPEYKDKRVLILSGHTHTKAAQMILPNMCARVLGRDDACPQYMNIELSSFDF